MFISSVHLYTYSKSEMIKGAATIDLEPGKLELTFTDSEREAIHNTVMGAYARNREDAIRKLREETPDVLRLAPPVEEIEEAEVEEIF